ncbi:hypothetical protein JCM14469_37120 [Desulfatiferula olefinivorans]
MKSLSCTMERTPGPPDAPAMNIGARAGGAPDPEAWAVALERAADPGERSDLLDDYLRTGFGRSESGLRLDLIANPYAIVATGRYGRREVGRRPEVGILFIFNDRIPEGAEGLIRDIVYPLWDRRVMVHHSTRTLSDCLSDAAKDIGTLVTLMDARFVCGVSTLYSRLTGRLREKVVFRRRREILAFLLERDRERHRRYGRPEDGPEPDLVRSPGGLEDVQSILTGARTVGGVMDLRDIERLGLMSTDECEALNLARDVVRRVLAVTETDESGSPGRLSLNRQHGAARALGYTNAGGRNGVDRFLTDLTGHMDRIMTVYRRFFLDLVPEMIIGRPVQAGKINTGTKWVNVTRGMITVTSSVKLIRHPGLMLSVFEESRSTGAPLSPETRRLIEAFGPGLAQAGCRDTAVMTAFESVLFDGPEGSDIPAVLLETGLLGAFVPVFAAFRHRREFGAVERRPMCERHLDILDRLKGLLGAHGSRVPFVSADLRRGLLWAGLFHDLYRIFPGRRRHRAAAREVALILARFKKDAPFVRRVLDLIDHSRRIIRFVTGEPVSEKARVTALVRSWRGVTPQTLTGACYLARAVIETRFAGRIDDFILADLSVFYNWSLGVLSGVCSPSSPDGDALAPDSLAKVTALDRKKHRGPCVHVLEFANTRTVTLACPRDPLTLCGVPALFSAHGMEVYDLRVADGPGEDLVLVVRVTPPKDRMFERRAWAGFEEALERFFREKPSPLSKPGERTGGPRRHLSMDRSGPGDSTRISVIGTGGPEDDATVLRAVTRAGGRVRFMRRMHDTRRPGLWVWVRTDREETVGPDFLDRMKEVLDGC